MTKRTDLRDPRVWPEDRHLAGPRRRRNDRETIAEGLADTPEPAMSHLAMLTNGWRAAAAIRDATDGETRFISFETCEQIERLIVHLGGPRPDRESPR